MAFVLRRCRELYNAALQERKEAWEKCGVSITAAGQSAQLPGIKEVPARIPRYPLPGLAGRAHPARPRLSSILPPRQARREARLSPLQGRQPVRQLHLQAIRQRGHAGQWLPGALEDRADRGALVPPDRGHAQDGHDQPGGRRLVCLFSCAEVPTQPLPPTGQETGIDLGLESFATLADGTMIHNPRCYRKAEAYLRRCQRRVARRKQGSHRRRKAVKLLAKAHLKVKRQRQDFQHKAALYLVRQYDTVYFEDLQTANMVKNHHLAKSSATRGGRRS